MGCLQGSWFLATALSYDRGATTTNRWYNDGIPHLWGWLLVRYRGLHLGLSQKGSLFVLKTCRNGKR